MKNFFKDFWDGLLLFFQKKGEILSAASTFYLLLCVIPLLLLSISLLGFFLGNLAQTQTTILQLGARFFPEANISWIEILKNILSKSLYAKAKFNVINIAFLCFGTLSFFNSVIKGVHHINNRKIKSLWGHFEGVLLVFFSLVLMGATIILPPVFLMMEKLLKNNFIIDTIVDVIPNAKVFLGHFSEYDFGVKFLINADIINLLLYLAYFTILFKWFFGNKLHKKDAFLGALIFVQGPIFGKYLFLLYMSYMREGLIKNYGDYYTYILGLMWVYILFGVFYFSVCFCQKRKERASFQEELINGTH